MNKKNSKKKAEQDSMWKEIIEGYFPQFLEFFFPVIHKEVDFKQGVEFLDKEFQKIVKENKAGKKIVDKLLNYSIIKTKKNYCRKAKILLPL